MQLKHLTELLSVRGEKKNLSISTGISTGNISDWVSSNKKSTPKADALCKVASYFNCSVDYLLDRTEIKETNQNIYKFPIYDQEAAAGAGILGREGNFSMEDIKSNDIPKNAVFGIHIKGKSMEPDIPDDSIVLLDTRFEPSYLNKKIVVAEIDGEVICKEFNQFEDYIWFKSVNREYSKDDRFVYDNNYRIIGEVVKIIN